MKVIGWSIGRTCLLSIEVTLDMRQQIHRSSARALRVRYKVGFDIRQPLQGCKTFDTVRSCNLKKMHLVLQRLFCSGPQVLVDRQAHGYKTPSRVRDVAPIFLYDKVRCVMENNKPERNSPGLNWKSPARIASISCCDESRSNGV